VHLASLLRMMVKMHGYRAWGHRGFPDYVMEELRQRSPRRFQDLVRIDRAITERPLVLIGAAWRRGEITVSQARELARVATPETEKEWLEAARHMSVRRLRREVHRALRSPAAGLRPADDSSRRAQSIPGSSAGSGEPVDETAVEVSAEGADLEEEDAVRIHFTATAPVDVAWQVFLETSRRMEGFDSPVHGCVEDLLAEYASGCTWLPEAPGGAEREGDAELSPGEPGHAESRLLDETAADLDLLRRAGGTARLAVNPLEGLPSDGDPDPQDLHRRIRWVIRVQQRVDWHEMRLALVMASRKRYLRLGFNSFALYAEEALDMSPRAAWGLVSLARGLKPFPHVAEAFRRGRITALEAAEICRVTHGSTQRDWIARARTSTLQMLREEVAFVLATDDPTRLPPARPLPSGMHACVEPDAVRPGAGGVRQGGRTPGDVEEAGVDGAEPGMRGDPGASPISLGRGSGQSRQEVQTCASRTSATTATTAAHRCEQWYAAFGSDPSTMAEVMLAPAGRRRPVGFTAPESLAAHWLLTLRDCRDRLATLAKDAEAAACVSDSQCVAILLLNFLGQWASPQALKASRAMRIFTRDGWRCQAPRCRSRANLHAHHIVFRSRNGPDAPWNLVTVCRAHHEMLHAGKIRVRGRAPGTLIWAMGVNADGDVRERFCRGTRTEIDEGWLLAGGTRRVRAHDDWRAACDATP
jgi:hypothetical protein